MNKSAQIYIPFPIKKLQSPVQSAVCTLRTTETDKNRLTSAETALVL